MRIPQGKSRSKVIRQKTRSPSIKKDDIAKPIGALSSKIKVKDMQIMELLKEVQNLRELLVS
jgi:hypothetical protein